MVGKQTKVKPGDDDNRVKKGGEKENRPENSDGNRYSNSLKLTHTHAYYDVRE